MLKRTNPETEKFELSSEESKIIQLIHEGADLESIQQGYDFRTGNNLTFLMEAAYRGYLGVIKALKDASMLNEDYLHRTAQKPKEFQLKLQTALIVALTYNLKSAELLASYMTNENLAKEYRICKKFHGQLIRDRFKQLLQVIGKAEAIEKQVQRTDSDKYETSSTAATISSRDNFNRDNLNEFNSAVPEKKAAKSEKVQSEIDFSDEEAHFMQLLQKDFYHKLLLETKYLGFGDDLSVTISSKSTELMPIAGMAVARDREPYKYNAKKLDTALSHETALAYITQPQAQGIPPLIKILIILGFQTNNVSTFLSKREIPGLYASVRLEKTITPAELKLSNDYFDDRRSALITTLCDLGMASVLADICADYSAPTPELKELYDDNPIRKLPSAIQGKDSALFIKILNDVIKSWIDYFPILKSKLIVKASEEGFFDLVVQYIKTYPALRKVVEDTSEARQEFANTLIEKAIKAKDKIAEEYFKNHPLAFGLFSPWQFSHKQSNTNASTVAPQQHTKQRISKSGKF